MRILAITNMYPTAHSPFSGPFVKKQIEGLKRIGLDVELLHVDRAKNGMLGYVRFRNQIRARTVDFQPDIVHVMYGGVMADQVTRVIQNTPIVVSFCGSDLLGEPVSGNLRKLIGRYGVVASHKAARRATRIVVKSRNLCNALPSGIDRSKVRIIPNGVDLEQFKPLHQNKCRKRLGWRDDRMNVLFPTNRGDPIKRLDLALAAVETVRKWGIALELHQLTGVVHNEVPIWLNASDVVLLTSLHEGSPNIVKEALACNRPVVSVDVGDVRERIEGIEGCYLALPEPSDLAARLRLVYSGSHRVEGRMKMRELSLEGIASQLKKLYEEVVGVHGCAANAKFKRHSENGFPRNI